jgi:hypothetical protein
VGDARTYHIRTADAAAMDGVGQAATECGLRADEPKRSRLEGSAAALWPMRGRRRQHEQFVDRLMKDPAVVEFTW